MFMVHVDVALSGLKDQLDQITGRLIIETQKWWTMFSIIVCRYT